jgi:hypothetical protein
MSQTMALNFGVQNKKKKWAAEITGGHFLLLQFKLKLLHVWG